MATTIELFATVAISVIGSMVVLLVLDKVLDNGRQATVVSLHP